MTPSEVLNNLQDILNKKYQLEIKDNEDEFIDVPYVSDVDDEYKTHTNLGEADEKDEEEVPPEPEEETPPPETGGEAPVTGADPSMSGMEGMPGMEEEEPKTPSELGRIYELKKIYTRLIAIEAHLATSSNEEMLNLRKKVSQAIDLFDVLASNLDSFKEKVDEVIISFYKFLTLSYDLLKKYQKNIKGNDEEEIS